MSVHAFPDPDGQARHPAPWHDVAPAPRADRIATRALDIVGATVALVVLSPLLVVAAIAVALTSRGPVIFTQERVGRHERPFTIYKFRTMRTDNDDSEHRAYSIRLLTDAEAPDADGAGTFKLTHDPRITRVGAILRKYSIDELPQLVNVVKGDMALVGPRPALHWEVAHYRDEHRRRAAVRPGCTGVWQVSGRSTIPTLEMLDMDVAYAERRRFVTDLTILLRTPMVLLRGDGAH